MIKGLFKVMSVFNKLASLPQEEQKQKIKDLLQNEEIQNLIADAIIEHLPEIKKQLKF